MTKTSKIHVSENELPKTAAVSLHGRLFFLFISFLNFKMCLDLNLMDSKADL